MPGDGFFLYTVSIISYLAIAMHEQPAEISKPVEERKKGFLSQFSPVAVFFMGFGTSVFLVITVGFFVLLGILVSDRFLLASEKKDDTKVAAAAPTAALPTEASAPAEIKIEPLNDKDHVRGKLDAKVFVVEFSDLECPFCKKFHPTLLQMYKEYGDKIAWGYRHFPLDQLHPKARKEAEATECAAELGGNDAFWKFTDKIYEITPANNGLDPAKLPEIAKELGLDQKKFEDCLNSGQTASKVEAQYQQALAAGAQGTPYAVILAGDQKIPLSGAVPFEEIKSVLDQVLK